MSQPLFPANDYIGVPTNVLNNMWRIINKETAITADEHRDLQNLMALLRQQAEPMA